MEIADLDIRELIGAIGSALVPVVFKGVGKKPTPQAVRERLRLNAEIMGRLAAVLYGGEKTGPELIELIDLFTAHMQVEYSGAMKGFLGPEGELSRLRNPQRDAG
ncbi:hypothetical protein [Pseudomonas koreensis]|uniref:hypothetical protein n=1 Tax=Pseudomonas koreensis TaxID=198620 RepID=UPI002FC7E6AA